jgi:orotate phosphoribosyltransferase
VNEAEVLEVLQKRGALRQGHFLLSSGRHSRDYVQKFRVLEDPKLTQRFGEAIAQLVEEPFDVVVAPAVGAIVLGFAAALASGARSIFAERVAGALCLRRGFRLAPHERALVVEDVVTTGTSAAEVVRLVRDAGADPVAVACLVDRSDGRALARAGIGLSSLLRLRLESWDPSGCPLCAQGVPLEEPGSRRLATGLGRDASRENGA